MTDVGVIFGKNIAQHRAKKEYSKEFVAVSLGVSVAALTSWELGARTPPLEKCFAIADFYGVTLDSLINRKIDHIDDAIAMIGENPEALSSIEKINRMKAAGYTDQEIDEAVKFAIEWKTKKTAT